MYFERVQDERKKKKKKKTFYAALLPADPVYYTYIYTYYIHIYYGTCLCMQSVSQSVVGGVCCCFGSKCGCMCVHVEEKN